jgi:hypothetical protein
LRKSPGNRDALLLASGELVSAAECERLDADSPHAIEGNFQVDARKPAKDCLCVLDWFRWPHESKPARRDIHERRKPAHEIVLLKDHPDLATSAAQATPMQVSEILAT